MEQKGNFLVLSRQEFRDWLNKKTVTRTIKRLQVHHTAAPNYTTRKVVGGVAEQDRFKCLEGMRNDHIKNNGWSATGQHITIFEDGLIAISLDRDLNASPAGIKGANTGAICIENIGNFDLGGDVMLEEQKISVAYVYATLAKRFDLPVDTEHIVYHHWYDSDGDPVVDFKTGKQISKRLPSKTCPGTNFFGDGNSVEAAQKTFIPKVLEAYQNLDQKVEDEEMTAEEKKAFADLQEAVSGLISSRDTLKNTALDQAKTIKDQAERLAKLEDLSAMADVPAYAKEAVDVLAKAKDKNGKPIINTPSGRSKDFYDIITVLYRAGLIK